jgi:hypothetical protein
LLTDKISRIDLTQVKIMKILVNHLFLLSALTMMFSCTEEITEELQNEEQLQVTNTTPTAASFSNKSIRLVNKMDPNLSFTMHKAGTVNEACEIAAPSTGFNADDYDKTNSAYAQDCILDVQELDLSFHGADFEIQVDDNLCEYVSYVPYHYVAFPYGASDKTYYEVTCDQTCETANPTICGKTFDSHVTVGGDSDSIYTTGEFLNEIDSPEAACLYDWQTKYGTASNYPNCDIGTRTPIIVEMKSSKVLIAGPPSVEIEVCVAGVSAVTVVDTTEEPISCGGSILSCLAGAGVETMEEDEDTHALLYKDSIYNNQDLASFTKQITYSAPLEKGHFKQNLHLANFSRMCSNTSANKLGLYETSTLIGYELDLLNAGTFNVVTDTDPADVSLVEGERYSHHPFHSREGSQPYYKFTCYNNAYDVKAQIRLFIREWDKDFSEFDSYIDNVSDVNTGGSKHMDMGDDLQDNIYYWNDRDDWDDVFEDQGVFDVGQERCHMTDYSNQDLNDTFNFDNETLPNTPAFTYDDDGDVYDYRKPVIGDGTLPSTGEGSFPWAFSTK